MRVSVVLALTVLAMAGCATPDRQPPDDPGAQSPDDSARNAGPPPTGERSGFDALVRIEGTAHYVDLEGGFWTIRGNDGTTYDPVGGLPAEYRTEGMRLRVDAKLRPDVMSTHMAGPMVEIVKIEAL